MPACLVEHHRGMFVLSQCFGKAVEEGLHRRRIGIGQHQRKRMIRAGLDGGEDIGESEALIGKARRALTALSPNGTCPWE